MNETLFLEVIEYMGLSFPLSLPLILKNENQLYLRMVAYLNQEGVCICKKQLDGEGELHHGLVSRRDIMGGDFFNCIHDSRNCLLLCHSCHRVITRERAYRFLCHIFGEQIIKDWYDSLEFKSRFRKLPLQL